MVDLPAGESTFPPARGPSLAFTPSVPRSPEPDSSKSSDSCPGPPTSSSSGSGPEGYRLSRSWGSMTSVSRI